MGKTEDPTGGNRYKYEFMRGQGPGGQHRNRTDSACRATCTVTGLSAYADERSQHTSKRKATKELERRIEQAKLDKKADAKKAKRDEAIKKRGNVRTYNFIRGVVKDHRTGKTASTKDILGKAKLELLR